MAKGEDLSKAKKDAKAKLAATESTFRTIAAEFLGLQRRNGRAGVTLTKTEWLLDFAYPTLGDKRMVDIRSPDVLDVLRKVEIADALKQLGGFAQQLDAFSGLR